MDAIGLQGVTLPKVALPKMALDGYRESDMDYIRDGLVFHLDGINKGGVEGKWTDLVNGIEYTPNGDAAFIKNGIVGLFRTIDPFPISVPHQNCTLECCGLINGDSGQLLPFRTSNNNNIRVALFYKADSGAIVNPTASYSPNDFNAFKVNMSKEYINTTPILYSVNSSLCLVNGMCFTAKTSGSTTNKDGGCTVSSTTNIIHSIRIYDRLLTEDEMRHNQKVDIKRFGLKIQPPVMTLQEDWEDDYVPSGEGV